jgi:alpha-L-fucosidase
MGARKTHYFGLLIGLFLLQALTVSALPQKSAYSTTMTAIDGPYVPTLESLNARPVPEWYRDAKLGIFIHWGVYSVPGWAPLTGELDEVLVANATPDGEPGWGYWFAHNPYAEWYWNSLQIEGSETANYHAQTYGDIGYEDFVPMFNEARESWDPMQWVKIFADVGARYVVLTTKHHDGFLLWPSRLPNPNRDNWNSERDLVGELAEAVRAKGMRFGVYYSSGLDWTFRHPTIVDFETLLAAIPNDQAYADYALTHWNELIDRYNPDVLWNDLGFPLVDQESMQQRIYDMFARYFNSNPDGTVNDRFALGRPREEFHNTFYTAEYTEREEISEQVWESTRGMGYSFGYNQLDSEANVITVDELVDSFVDIVSKNGNLLLNIGPRADGSIPEVYLNVLLGLSSWLDVNSEAIFNTRPYITAEATTSDGGEIRFTQTVDGSTLYAILITPITGESITIEGLSIDEGATIDMLGIEDNLKYELNEDSVTIMLPPMVRQAPSPAYSLRINPAPGT